MIEFRNVSLAMGGRTVLNDVDLDIGASEFIGVLGANGAGKTTLLRAILGLVPSTQGELRVFGQPAVRGNRDIGYMPQARASATNTRLSCRDAVASVINGQRLGMPYQGRAERAEVDRVLELVGATTLAQRPLFETSGGERQRLLLAQALIGGPKLLLLDEPLISLDPHHQENVIRLVKSLQVELGISVLFSAHELNPLLGALDRVLYLANGHAALGTVDEVITGERLSRLYGSAIEVIRLQGRIFVISGNHDLEAAPHSHAHEDHHHA